MYNYDNEYAQPGYESKYEFNPEYESNFEMENFENEFSNEYENEYGLNPEFNTEQNYESQNEYEEEYRPGNIQVRDHRSGSTSRPVIVPTRPGNIYRPGASSYQRSRYSNSPSYYRPYRSNYYRPAASAYRGAQYYRRNWPYTGNNANYNYGNFPGRRWHHRYPQSIYNTSGTGYMDQSSQYSQATDPGASSAPNTGGNIPNYILDTIKNLSQQVAATNANVEAMQASIANPGQTGGTATPPPDSATPPATGPSTPGQAPAADHEMGEYEYDMENEMMNYEEGSQELNEMELAAELLATNNEMELDHFLGGLVGGGLKKLLGGIIKKALPVAGAAAGTFFGGPLGAQIGEKIGSAASGMFELELEGLSNEDQEFEVARAIIRLANDAAAELANGASTGDPDQDAKNALVQSASRNAPGLLVKKHHHHHHHHHPHDESGYGGHWHRRGNKIVIENAF